MCDGVNALAAGGRVWLIELIFFVYCGMMMLVEWCSNSVVVLDRSDS